MFVCAIPDGGDSVPTLTEWGVCEQCGEPLPAPKPRARKDQPRRFCRTACRAAWHQRERERVIARILERAAQEIAATFRRKR